MKYTHYRGKEPFDRGDVTFLSESIKRAPDGITGDTIYGDTITVPLGGTEEEFEAPKPRFKKGQRVVCAAYNSLGTVTDVRDNSWQRGTPRKAWQYCLDVTERAAEHGSSQVFSYAEGKLVSTHLAMEYALIPA
jgi:hypothetical protein